MILSIGVIIPTFNRPDQTLEAVRSVLSQTRPPEQIVVVDDGSPDESRDSLVRNLTGLPVEIILSRHCGHPGRVRNVGLGSIKTTHVAFLDSDDLWIPQKLEIQEALARSGVRAQGSGFVVAGSNSIDNLTPSDRAETLSLKELLVSNSLCNSSVLVQRNLLEMIGGLPTSYGVRGIEDYAAWLRVAAHTDWTLLEAPLVIYSDSPATSMRGTNEFSIPENTLALLDFASWLQTQGCQVPSFVKVASKAGDRALLRWASKQHLS
jgi:glycosyltransferase involved in cell wall biosynthesis